MKRLTVLLAGVCAALAVEKLSFTDIPFRPSLSQKKTVNQAYHVPKSTNTYRRMSMVDAGPVEAIPIEDAAPGAGPVDVAKAIQNSMHESSCTFTVDVELVDKILANLEQLQLLEIRDYEAKQAAQSRRKKSRLATGIFRVLRQASASRNSFLRPTSPAPRHLEQIFYRYGPAKTPQIQPRLLSEPQFAACVPSYDGMGDNGVYDSPSQVDLKAFKSEFAALQKSYDQVFAPFNLNENGEPTGVSGEAGVAAGIAVANSAVKSHQELETQITELGSKVDKFKLEKNEVLYLFDAVSAYNQAKLKANAMDPNFVAKDEALGSICASFRTSFEDIDKELGEILSLNDDLNLASKDLAAIDQSDPVQMGEASMLIPKIAVATTKIATSLAKIQQTLDNTDTIKREVDQTIGDLKALAVNNDINAQVSTGDAWLAAALTSAVTLTMAVWVR